jgi:hypothetical protein
LLDKFNFYDLLGYLIPGAIVTLALYWVGTSGLGLPLPPINGDLASSFVFLGVSYLAGHLVQAIGESWESKLCDRDGGRLSERLLLAESANHWVEKRGFSTEFRQRIIAHAAAVFHMSAEAPSDPVEAKAWRQELFNECYALVVQENAAQHTEIFLAINGLSRGVYMASGIGLLASLFIAIKQQLFWDLGQGKVPHPGGGQWPADLQLFWLGLLGVAASLVTGWLARKIFMRYRAYFAESVYYSFDAWFGKLAWQSKLKG